jgi:hypothetical protein
MHHYPLGDSQPNVVKPILKLPGMVSVPVNIVVLLVLGMVYGGFQDLPVL